MKYFNNAYRRIRRWNDIRQDVRISKKKLLSSNEISIEEKDILRHTHLHIHNSDTMYVDNKAYHYISVGLSASRCVNNVLSQAPTEFSVKTVLDFACGYGRVLRFLRAMFPVADITAVEIDHTALEYCRRTFSAKTILSKTDFKSLNLPSQFDLIWCGSLCTHIDEQACRSLLQFFCDHLTEHGICLFTTHGQLPFERIQNKERSYGLSEDAQQKLIREYQLNGYGYADYPNQLGYGISVVSYQQMVKLAGEVGGWQEKYYLERGWDNHQDVYCFSKHPQNT